MIRKECNTCLSWDVPKDMCLRAMHGMACVVGDICLPPRGGVFAAGADKCCDPPMLVAVDAPRDNGLIMQPGGVTNHRAGDTQVAGDHYKKMGVEPWDVVDTWPLEQRIGAYRHGALKYLMRMGSKDQNAQEIAKGKHYMEKLLEVLS